MPISDEHLRALGRVTVNFSLLEFHLGWYVSILLGEDSGTGQIVNAQLSFKTQIDLLMSLARYKIKEQIVTEQLEDLIRRAKDIEDRRNQLVHSAWLLKEGAAEGVIRLKITARAKHGLKHTREEVRAANIDAFATEIQGLVGSFMLYRQVVQEQVAVPQLPKLF